MEDEKRSKESFDMICKPMKNVATNFLFFSSVHWTIALCIWCFNLPLKAWQRQRMPLSHQTTPDHLVHWTIVLGIWCFNEPCFTDSFKPAVGLWLILKFMISDTIHDHFVRDQTGSKWLELPQIGSDWLKLDQTLSKHGEDSVCLSVIRALLTS